MGERKVLNKYYPPDFDPSLILRKKGAKKEQIKVRMMLPMSLRCNTCGNYIYKGTKFNSRKEDAAGEDYLGVQVYRFYFKCTRCSAELVMKTDPKNSDYTVEAGATRNYEPWRDKDEQIDEALRKREEEEAGNAMKALENRTADSKREIDIVNALDEMRTLKNKHATLGHGDVLAALQRQSEEEAALFEQQVEAAARSAFRSAPAAAPGFVRRLEEDDEDGADGGGAGGAGWAGAKRARLDEGAGAGAAAAAALVAPAATKPPPPRPAPAARPLVVVKRKEPAPAAAAPGVADGSGAGALAGLLGAYGSSGEESGGSP